MTKPTPPIVVPTSQMKRASDLGGRASQDISISEKTLPLSLKVYVWSRQCRELYGKMGIYAVYCVKTNKCLYVGKSTDLGKRILRFFSPRAVRPTALVFRGQALPNPDNRASDNFPYYSKDIYVEVTEFSNEWKLDAFERTMIAIKKPLFNILLNYNVKDNTRG